MKRKRFIKLLMGKFSCSKREAEDSTHYALYLYGSYSCAYSYIASVYSEGDNVCEIFQMDWMNLTMKRISDAGKEISECLHYLAEALHLMYGGV